MNRWIRREFPRPVVELPAPPVEKYKGMIIAEELSKWFDNFQAVERVSLEVQSGQVLVLLGQNGAGKTTTVRMLTSILRPSSGRAWICGYDVVQQADKVRGSVGVLTENHGLYARMRADEYLEFYASLYGINAVQARPRIAAMLDQFGLADARKKRLGEFSKGMRQKLALVRAIIHDPPVLLLDEPTSAMDPRVPGWYATRSNRSAPTGGRSCCVHITWRKQKSWRTKLQLFIKGASCSMILWTR
jgi:ABC-type sugar transport system ATPase subunit